MDALEALPTIDAGDSSLASFSQIDTLLERGFSEEFNAQEASHFFEAHLPWLAGDKEVEDASDSDPGHSSALQPRQSPALEKHSSRRSFLSSLAPFPVLRDLATPTTSPPVSGPGSWTAGAGLASIKPDPASEPAVLPINAHSPGSNEIHFATVTTLVEQCPTTATDPAMLLDSSRSRTQLTLTPSVPNYQGPFCMHQSVTTCGPLTPTVHDHPASPNPSLDQPSIPAVVPSAALLQSMPVPQGRQPQAHGLNPFLHFSSQLNPYPSHQAQSSHCHNSHDGLVPATQLPPSRPSGEAASLSVPTGQTHPQDSDPRKAYSENLNPQHQNSSAALSGRTNVKKKAGGRGAAQRSNILDKRLTKSSSVGHLSGPGGLVKEPGAKPQPHHRTKREHIARLEAELESMLSLANKLESENLALLRKERLLNLMVHTGERTMHQCQPGDGGIAPHLLSLIQTFRSSVNQMLSPQLLQQMQHRASNQDFSTRDFRSTWKVFVTEVADALMQMTAQGLDGAVMQRMEELCDRASSWIGSVCVYKPSAVLDALSVNITTGEPCTPPLDFWQQLVAKLNLTPQQETDIYDIYKIYSAALQSIRAQESALLSSLSAMVSCSMRNKAGALTNQPGCGLVDDGELTEQANKVQAAFRHSHLLHFMSGFLCNALLTPLQRCLVYFHSMPSFPRYKMILLAVAAAKGDPSASLVSPADF